MPFPHQPSRVGATLALRALVKCHAESEAADFAVKATVSNMQQDNPCGWLRWKGTETEDCEYTAGSYSIVSAK